MIDNNDSNRPLYVLDSTIPYSKYTPIDLSDSNRELLKVKLDDAASFGAYIDNHLKKSNASAAFGGYNEHRNLYKTSSIFTGATDDRNIHIGLDIWLPTQTPVLAALDGIIHSFKNNIGKGNYGPTIILQHQTTEGISHTLYGHLSLESIANLSVGDAIKQGQVIGFLGDASVNGGYPPHLHFQLIKNLDGNTGDYPGVCSSQTLAYYLNNCPNPNLLLKILST